MKTKSEPGSSPKFPWLACLSAVALTGTWVYFHRPPTESVVKTAVAPESAVSSAQQKITTDLPQPRVVPVAPTGTVNRPAQPIPVAERPPLQEPPIEELNSERGADPEMLARREEEEKKLHQSQHAGAAFLPSTEKASSH